MATGDLMNIYNGIYSKKVAHCALCYKTEVETRLLHSKVYKKVLETLKYSEMFLHNEQLCYMCENRMKAFMQLVDNLQLALEVQRIYIRADMCTKYRKNLMKENLDKCQNDFTNFRKRKQLYKTNVLVVDTNVIPNTTPAPKPVQTKTPKSLEIETVIINDNDPFESKVEFTNDLEQNPLELPIILPDSNILLAFGRDKNIYMLPAININSNILNGGFDNKNDTMKPEIVKNTEEDVNKKLLNYSKIQELNIQIKRLQTDNQLSNNYVRTQNKQTNSTTESIKKRSQEEIIMEKRAKTTNLPLIVDCRSDDSAFKEINEENVTQLFTNVCHTRVPEVVKHPIRTASEVDWEDKIPMEVISFADDQ